MRPLVAAAFYAGFLGLSNGALANGALAQDLAPLLEGDMRKLALAEAPAEVPATPFEGEDGAAMTLRDLAGEVAVVNFWATWCAPCREEMPTLAALQEALGDEGVRVATIAVGRNDPAEMERFLDEVGAGALPRWRDARQELARDMGVLGLPVTVILDREGREVARLTGDADWASDSALAVLRALAEG
jgi:thiol-disulfide isomerase/thioredoxin